MASWQRSQDYGVPLGQVEPSFAGGQGAASLFLDCGRTVLSTLTATLADEPVSMMLTDADGFVLHREVEDHALLRALDDVHLAPGFAYSEREVGTNGLGMALADRAPSLVLASEHYAQSLCVYTCAAAPVLDQLTGRLEGSVNLTTWASTTETSEKLLLALAQSAAANTAALMLTRAGGHRPASAGTRGAVFRVIAPRTEPGSGTLYDLGTGWRQARDRATAALASHLAVAATGEAEAGRTTLLAQAIRQAAPHARILAASPPAVSDTETWLSLWAPEACKPDTVVILRDADCLPVWAATRARDALQCAAPAAIAMTTETLEGLPEPLKPMIGAAVAVPALRERPDDILPLAQHFGTQARRHAIDLTAAAGRALRAYEWPGNVGELRNAILHAALYGDVIDVAQLPTRITSRRGTSLTRIESVERDEIARALSDAAGSVNGAAARLGLSRATVYRKIAHYGIRRTSL